VDAIAGTDALIADTRKTMPGMRCWDKHAVVCGGGRWHRSGLDDAALFKDNHLVGVPLADLGQTLTTAIAKARADRDLLFAEVEVDSLDQLEVVLTVPGVDLILLDNMPPRMMQEAVGRRDEVAPNICLEASGGITLATVRAAAESGVDRIAVGAITRDAMILDIGLDA
jgi:nicotinate-nucleotide pyrophosphorylase (carboxylating)